MVFEQQPSSQPPEEMTLDEALDMLEEMFQVGVVTAEDEARRTEQDIECRAGVPEAREESRLELERLLLEEESILELERLLWEADESFSEPTANLNGGRRTKLVVMAF